ncbi:MAG: hypothetical protein DRP65_07325 [Planctomycetota bacterium]|nr:MAG: hypothetical protein DRP65_07325 [Planctomycetota bacterium]
MKIQGGYASMMISGHQYDHTGRFARFVFHSTFAKVASLVFTPIPLAISSAKAASMANCPASGNQREPNKLRIQRTFSKFIFRLAK